MFGVIYTQLVEGVQAMGRAESGKVGIVDLRGKTITDFPTAEVGSPTVRATSELLARRERLGRDRAIRQQSLHRRWPPIASPPRPGPAPAAQFPALSTDRCGSAGTCSRRSGSLGTPDRCPQHQVSR